MGPALLFDTVTYRGKSHETSPGLFLEPDDMQITRILAAYHIRATFGAFFIAGQLGLGLALIDSVDAVEEDRFAGTRFKGELFASTSAFGLELTARAGGKFLLGEAAAMSVFVFTGVGSTSAPKEGDDLSPLVRTGPASHLFLGLGLAFEFGSVAPPVRPRGAYDDRW